MNLRLYRLLAFFFSLCLLLGGMLSAHDNIWVHPEITKIAYEKWSLQPDSTTGNTTRIDRLARDWGFTSTGNFTGTFALTSTLGSDTKARPIGGFWRDLNEQSYPLDDATHTTGWLTLGAINEDIPADFRHFPPRPLNHFYTPIGPSRMLTDGLPPAFVFILTDQTPPSDSYT